MKYGLPKEDRPKRKWKISMENELRDLQGRVVFLENQLDVATKKIEELTSPKLSKPFAFVQDRPQYQSIWDYDTVTKKAVRYLSITCMPSYKEKSFEELRYEDYVLKGIGFSNQIQRYKDSKVRSSRTEKHNIFLHSKNWKPEKNKSDGPATNQNMEFIIPWYITPKSPKAPWPFGPLCSNGTLSNKIVAGSSNVRNESALTVDQNRPFFTFHRDAGVKNSSDIGIKIKDENLSSQILMELKKMRENISSINEQLLKMNSNISDVSSRVSVMDSRLSAVDMFVTMQRFDKKWQGLESKLTSLETPSPPQVLCSFIDKSTVQDSFRKCTTPEETFTQTEKLNIHKENFPSVIENKKSPQISQFKKSGIPKRNMEDEAGSFSTWDTSDINLSDFVRSISCTDITMESKILSTSGLSDQNSVSDISSKVKHETATIEMSDLKSSFNFIENLSPRESESIINSSRSVPSVYEITDNINKEERNAIEKTQTSCVNNETDGIFEKTKPGQESVMRSRSFENSGKILNDPLGVSGRDLSFSNPDSLLMRDTDNDVDDFVIVGESDLEEPLAVNSKSQTIYSPTKQNQDEASSACDFKMYSDITEYLEVNLGKKKNLVYEFGFEAKPDY